MSTAVVIRGDAMIAGSICRVCAKRKNTSDDLGQDYSSSQRQRNYQSKSGISVHNQNADSVYDSEPCAYQKRNPKFFKCNPKNITGTDLVQGKTADNQG